MAAPNFSETQFLVGFLREYLNQFKISYPLLWRFFRVELPSTRTEKKTGADFIFRFYSHSQFIQFKRSHCIKKRGRGFLNDPEKNLRKNFFPYYRFEIYNTSNSRQFEKLRDLSELNSNDKSYYCAPLFHESEEFNKFFSDERILENSVLIDCEQFRSSSFLPPFFDINSGRHFIAYNSNLDGYILSEPIPIKINKASNIDSSFEKDISTNENMDKSKIEIEKILKWCFIDAQKEKYFYGDRGLFDISYGIEYLINKYNILWIPIIKK